VTAVSLMRWTLVALLAAATVLFAVGVIAERSSADTHTEPARAHAEGAGSEATGAHDEAGEGGAAASEQGHGTTASGETSSNGEQVLGVDLESTPLIVLGVLAGLGLAALTTSRFGALRGVLLAVALAALAWAALDIRELVHQLDESRTGIAIVAALVAVLHVAAAAVAGRLAAQRNAPA
jgi:hypothetical protein